MKRVHMVGNSAAHGARHMTRLLLLLCCLVCVIAPASAEQQPAWLLALSNADGFTWTAENEWVYQRTGSKQFTDGRIVLGLEAATYSSTGEVLICVFAAMEDGRGGYLSEITRMELVVGEEKWSWHHLLQSGGEAAALLGEPERDVLLALGRAEHVELQIHFLSRHMIVSFTDAELEGIHEAATNLLDVLEAVDSSPESITGTFEITYPVHRNNGGITANTVQ